jgi:hypothetical protein
VSYLDVMSHRHHHYAGHGHPAEAAPPSLLRMSATGRLAMAVAVATALWIVTLWVVL